MLVRPKVTGRLRRVAGLGALALVLCAAGLGSGPTMNAQAAAGPTLYGQVVAVGPSALVLSLPADNGAWVAVNVTSQTVVASQSGGPSALSGIEDSDWALVRYAVSRKRQGHDLATWVVARTITYSTSPISTTGQSVHVSGRVTGLTEGGFTMTQGNGTVWSVEVQSSTNVLLGQTAASLSFLQVGDAVQVWGSAAGNTIVATKVAYRVASRKGNGRGGQRGSGRGHHPRG